MEYELILLLKAKKELTYSWKWYENRQPGLGDKFKAEIFRSFSLIIKNPKHYPEKILTLREIRLRVFPFLVIYKIDERKKNIVVVSIFHTSRNPKKKLSI